MRARARGALGLGGGGDLSTHLAVRNPAAKSKSCTDALLVGIET